MIDFLVIDDEQSFRDRLVRALNRRGYQVVGAASISEAMQCLETEQVKHALVDLKMPGKSGLELIPMLLALQPQLKIVMLTGYGSIATTQAAIKAGAHAYLTKPCDIERIIAAFGEQPAHISEVASTIPSLAQVEWEHIQRILSDHDGNVTHAAKALGLNRRSLQRRLAKAPFLR